MDGPEVSAGGWWCLCQKAEGKLLAHSSSSSGHLPVLLSVCLYPVVLSKPLRHEERVCPQLPRASPLVVVACRFLHAVGSDLSLGEAGRAVYGHLRCHVKGGRGVRPVEAFACACSHSSIHTRCCCFRRLLFYTCCFLCSRSVFEFGVGRAFCFCCGCLGLCEFQLRNPMWGPA